MRRFALILIVLAGCKKTAPRYEGPLRVELGDCADAAVWVSGPRPAPIVDPKAPKVASNDPDEGGEGAFASLTGTGDIKSGVDDTYGGLLGTESGEMSGGIGISTNRYGTPDYTGGGSIGGGMRGRTSAVPTVRIGQPVANGDLDKAIIRRYIKRNIQKIQYCYEKELLAKPKIAGTVQTEFFIGPEGHVASSTATGVDPNVSGCVAGVIKSIEFPKPKGGPGVQVKYPFTFSLPGSNTGRGLGTGVASVTPLPAAGSGSDQPKADPKPSKPAKPRYVAGVLNPLAAQLPALEECFRTNPKPYGVVTVKLTTGPAAVHGVEGDVAKCVSEAVQKLSQTTAQVCSIAFGTMPISDAPAVEITPDAIKYGGTLVGDPKKEAEGGHTFKIDALFERIEAEVKRDSALTTPVSVIGPLVVRPLDSTPINVVSKVITTILAGGGDYVLAAATGNDWRLLHQAKLPMVPVPLGTGGGWAIKGAHRDASAQTEERVQISILVQKDQMWIGQSRIMEFYQIPMLASREPDWDKLESALKDHKKTAFLVDRTDIDIAGEAVTYGDIVKAIDIAVKVGFVDFTFTHPANLARPPL